MTEDIWLDRALVSSLVRATTQTDSVKSVTTELGVSPQAPIRAQVEDSSHLINIWRPRLQTAASAGGETKDIEMLLDELSAHPKGSYVTVMFRSHPYYTVLFLNRDLSRVVSVVRREV
jgi:hypothetical protein